MAAAAALDIDPGKVQAASFNDSDLDGIAIQTGPLGNPAFPTAGNDFLILSTGIATDAKLPDTEGNHSGVLDGLNNSQGHDMVQLDLTLVAPLDASCLRFDWAFFSEEFPEFVGTDFNDGFVAQIGGKSFSIVANQIIVSPGDSNVARDPTDSSVMDVSSALAFHAGTATTYDGATELLVASVPVIGGSKVQIVFYVQDLGDSIFDSAVFLDNVRWTQDTGAACPSVVQPPQAFFTAEGAWSINQSKAWFLPGSVVRWICDPNDPNANVVLRFQQLFGDVDIAVGTGRTTFTHTISGGIQGVACFVNDVLVNKFAINPILIDPSGVIFDLNSGLPVPGATVLLEVEGAPSVFDPAPLDPFVKDPLLNPETSGLDGRYGWDVAPGTYRVQVNKLGCTPATSIVVTVPPEVTDLDVGLDCADTDGDGIPDFAEPSTDTNPNLADTDTNGTNDGGEDPDGDGLTNLEELFLGTDPLTPDNVDADGDGCTSAQEAGTDQSLGGRRDAANFWDFFDPSRDGAVAVTDFFALLQRFGAVGDASVDPLSPPPAAPAYHPLFDRGPSLGPNIWNLGPADGAIAVTDFFALLGQFGHVCA